ncbi:hypothetical protein QA649_27915 [Bradyrhizobium sp. CB1717]|uniref:hypothetical protein n=1 Tax=Bradyrhizobium sp. CB1717 TaxID=3039154 RepID=UPI0024B1B4E3|nr:hypothetical protein [Bradyrhizobium sp. CB1717]WFU21915.1 hypothetical protein QA649_27915 [Bradyrhizobium sp. CB1717]
MSFEQKLHEAMRSASEHVSVRKATNLGKQALLDRIDVLDANKTINLNNELSGDVKAAAKRHELSKHLEKSRALDDAIKAAEQDIVRSLPLIEQPATAGAAQIDFELRSNFQRLPEAQQQALLKNSEATRMALARAPRELTSLGELQHARLTDEVRRSLYPAAMAKVDADRSALDAAKQCRDMHRQTARSTFGTPIETHATVITPAA